MVADFTTAVGIDVGGPKKGFHAIVMRQREIVAKAASCDATEIVTWCSERGAAVVAVDAPIGWSKSGRARPAERALMHKGIWCFSTPTKTAAKAHPKNHFGWMLQGAALYRALDKAFARFDGSNERVRPICFETFPHAIACALSGALVTAKNKRETRRALLAKAGIRCDSLTNIDFVDAALCALTAEHFANGRYTHCGDADEGCIVTPKLD